MENVDQVGDDAQGHGHGVHGHGIGASPDGGMPEAWRPTGLEVHVCDGRIFVLVIIYQSFIYLEFPVCTCP